MLLLFDSLNYKINSILLLIDIMYLAFIKFMIVCLYVYEYYIVDAFDCYYLLTNFIIINIYIHIHKIRFVMRHYIQY